MQTRHSCQSRYTTHDAMAKFVAKWFLGHTIDRYGIAWFISSAVRAHLSAKLSIWWLQTNRLSSDQRIITLFGNWFSCESGTFAIATGVGTSDFRRPIRHPSDTHGSCGRPGGPRRFSRMQFVFAGTSHLFEACHVANDQWAEKLGRPVRYHCVVGGSGTVQGDSGYRFITLCNLRCH